MADCRQSASHGQHYISPCPHHYNRQRQIDTNNFLALHNRFDLSPSAENIQQLSTFNFCKPILLEPPRPPPPLSTRVSGAGLAAARGAVTAAVARADASRRGSDVLMFVLIRRRRSRPGRPRGLAEVGTSRRTAIATSDGGGHAGGGTALRRRWAIHDVLVSRLPGVVAFREEREADMRRRRTGGGSKRVRLGGE